MFGKLIVDGKIVYVFEEVRNKFGGYDIPDWIERMSYMTGVEIKKASEAERIPFRQLEDKLRKQRKSNEKHT